MNAVKKCVATAALMIIAQPSISAPFAVEARSLGMGNISVVTSDIATAAFANPAMLAYQKQRNDFSLLLPGVGAYLDDSDGMVDLIDAYQAADAAGNAAGQLAAYTQLTTGAKTISAQVAGATAIGFSGDTYSLAVAARSDILVAGTVTGTSADPFLTVGGVQTTEVGLSLARNLKLMGHKVSIGVTPKIINVKGIFVNESLATVDAEGTGLLDGSTEVDFGELSTLDAGVVVELSKNIQAGLVAKNLITDEVNTGVGKISIETESRAGIAYRGGFFTLGADLDLTENDPVASLGDKQRMLMLGAEFNAFDIAQLRVGMQKNIASGISEASKESLVTAGVGFWFGFHLDVSVISGSDVLGIFAQTGFRF